jgi:TetR/AcrR family transcriptional regulator
MLFQQEFEHDRELFDAALKEFIAHGYEHASLNTILEAAGMSKGQFYYYFKNKEELYLALINVLIERKKAFLAGAMSPEDLNQDIFTIFKTQMKYGMAFTREYPAISQFSESFLREKGSPIYQKALALHDFENNAAITALIQRALARGEFRPDLPGAFILSLIAYLLTHIADLADLSTADQFEAGVEHVVEFIRRGLARQA